MSSSTIFQTIYALFAIVGTSLVVVRLRAGDGLEALWPALVVAFCVYRIFALFGEK